MEEEIKLDTPLKLLPYVTPKKVGYEATSATVVAVEVMDTGVIGEATVVAGEEVEATVVAGEEVEAMRSATSSFDPQDVPRTATT